MSVETEYDRKFDLFRDVLKQAAQIASELSVSTDMHGYEEMSGEHHERILEVAPVLAAMNRKYQTRDYS